MNAPASRRYRVGLIGARGYVGSEIIRLIARHPNLELAYVSSREREGRAVADFEPDAGRSLRYVNYNPTQALAENADAVVLALPNGLAGAWADAFDASTSTALLLDLSADFRFDNTWYYGLPELTRGHYSGQRRISNPGCYATAMQLVIAPMRDIIDGPVQCFGVSGYSGAGTQASDKNNAEKLKDNLMPYALTGHIHEREAALQIGCAVQFMPHVAPHFRGLSITANMPLTQSCDAEQVLRRYCDFYHSEPLVKVSASMPWLASIAGSPKASVGGFTLSEDGRRLVAVSVLDNLLKGAASQAVQNINRAFDLPETLGIL